jgi:hypothetical protein
MESKEHCNMEKHREKLSAGLYLLFIYLVKKHREDVVNVVS